MALRDLVNQVFRRTTPALQTTVAAEHPQSESAYFLTQKFGAELERGRVLDACLSMYKTDPRVKKMHRLLARDIVKGGYIIRSKDAEALDVAKAMQERLKLNQRLDDYVRLAARDGDLFLQIEIDEQMQIVDVSRKPTRQMRRNSNSRDQFNDPTHAFWMSDSLYTGQVPPKNAIWFANWEMIHARWEHDEGERYGWPMMASAVGPYKKSTEGEIDVAVRRKTRSGLRYLHALDGASFADLEAYKEQNQSALSQPFAAIADFFTNKKGSISVLQGDGDLENMGDVKHHIATMFAAGEVPMELVAYGEGLNRDTLAAKKEEYDESLDVLRDWVSAQIIVPLLEREWLLHGIMPEGVQYSIEWRAKSQIRPTDLRDIADAAMRLRILGYSEDVVRAVVAQYLPHVDPEMLDSGNDDGAAQRMADIMAQMRGGLA